MTTTTFTNGAEARAALKVAAAKVWSTGTTVELKTEKCMGGEVGWTLTLMPKAPAPGTDTSCTACGMTAHTAAGCPA